MLYLCIRLKWRNGKGTPHCTLAAVKALTEAGKVSVTASAFNGARELGIRSCGDVCRCHVPHVRRFSKSMTTHGDHRIWQDAYHAKTENSSDVYLKLSVINDVLIVSFKEL